MALAPLDALQVDALLLRDRAANPQLQQLDVAANGVERCAELVAHHRQKFRLRAIGALGGFARHLELT